MIEQMLRHPKPIIAAVNGPAVAGGAGVVLAADLVVGPIAVRLFFTGSRIRPELVDPIVELALRGIARRP